MFSARSDLDAEMRERCGESRGRGGVGRGGRSAGRDLQRRVSSRPTRGPLRWRRATGLFAYHRTTDADFSVTARTPGRHRQRMGGRRSRRLGTRWTRRRSGASRLQKAVASRNPQAIEPGLYTAVLEPLAVTDLVPLLGGALSARSADEGRSPFSSRAAARGLASRSSIARVTLYSDPADPALLGQPFDAEGLPLSRSVWIEQGVLKNLSYSRFWAQKQGMQPTGPPLAGGLTLAGGTKSTEELIAGCARGILVTPLLLHPRRSMRGPCSRPA